MTARVYRADDDARRTDAVLVAVIEAHLRAAPDCGTTHHAGCACHEARRDAREREPVAEVERLRTGLGYFGGRDDERIDALESALRASLARWRAARGRYTPFPHCDVCGVRLAADGTETHDAECAVPDFPSRRIAAHGHHCDLAPGHTGEHRTRGCEVTT